jgi:hypothetical protein
MGRSSSLVVAACLGLAGCGGTDANEAPVRSAKTTTLPGLPSEGLVVQSGKNSIAFLDLNGREIATIRGYRLEPKPGVPLAVVRGRKVRMLDLRGRRIGPFPTETMWAAVRRSRRRPCQPGAERKGIRFLLCHRDHGTSIRATVERAAEGERSLVTANPPPTPSARDAGKIGRWAAAFLSPDGRTLLLQWSAECEVPIAFVAPAGGGAPRVVSGQRDWTTAPESVAMGFGSDGRAIIGFPRGVCGGGLRRPGIYAVEPRTFTRKRIADFPGDGLAVMWGPYAAAPAP